jgi:hypothetical protein
MRPSSNITAQSNISPLKLKMHLSRQLQSLFGIRTSDGQASTDCTTLLCRRHALMVSTSALQHVDKLAYWQRPWSTSGKLVRQPSQAPLSHLSDQVRRNARTSSDELRITRSSLGIWFGFPFAFIRLWCSLLAQEEAMLQHDLDICMGTRNHSTIFSYQGDKPHS